MKVKFIKVWDDMRFGYVKFIILQVEETDDFLTEANFNPGYKFIIQAMYNRVGAAGGHSFNAYYGESVRNKSKKIQSIEADVLGFYLQNVPDIYQAPDELYTEKIWDVVVTDRSKIEEDDFDDVEYLENNIYKVLVTSIYENSQELVDNLMNTLNSLQESSYSSDINIDEIKEIIHDNDKKFKNLGVNLVGSSRVVELVLIDKNDLKVVRCKPSSNSRIIAEYLWLPCDELPLELWSNVVNKNEGYSLYRVFNLNEENIDT